MTHCIADVSVFRSAYSPAVPAIGRAANEDTGCHKCVAAKAEAD